VAADQIEVQADLEIRLAEGQRGRLLRVRVGHEERRRAHDATAMGLENAARHAGAEAEVVRGDDDAHR